MSEEHRPSIADSERSPASEAADRVDIGPDALNEEDENRREPGHGTDPTAGEGGDSKQGVPPARSHH